MSWQERDYGTDDGRGMGRPGGDWSGVRPTLDNPVTWSLPMGRFAGVTVRIHLFFIVFIIVEILQAIAPPAQGVSTPLNWYLTLVMVGSLWVMVLLHEFGHVAACRSVGGDANEILMWPLGGLAYCMPPNRWKAHLITVIGGPAVNVTFLVIITPMLGLMTGHWKDVAIPNPFDGFVGIFHVQNQWSLLALYLFNRMNMIMLLFNLLPMFPMDGGRILQAVLWRWMGYSRSMRIAVRIGYFGAIGLAIFGLVTTNPWLIGMALFGGFTCYVTYKQLQWTDSQMGYGSDEFAMSLHQGVEEEESPVRSAAAKRAERQALREEEEAREVDRILEKIAQSGIDSLSRTERGILKRVTERKRQQK